MSGDRSWRLLYAALLVVVPTLSVVAMLTLPSDDLDPVTVVESPPSTTIARPVEIDDIRVVNATLTWTDPPVVTSPGGSGRISQVRVEVGETITTGTPVMDVDGTTILALASDIAVTLPVDHNAPPSMIEAVSELFRATGVLDEPSRVWDDGMQEALAGYLELVGAPTSPRFDPSLVVWLPQSELPVGEVTVAPAQPVPPVGEPVVTGVPQLTDIDIDPATASAGASPLLPSREYVVTINGTRAGGWNAMGPLPGTLTGAQAAITGNTDQVQMELTLAEPVEVVSLPASALVTSDDGSLCVVPQDGNPQSVEVLRSQAQVVEVLAVNTIVGKIIVRPDADVDC